MEESDLRALIQQYAIEARLEQGEASLTSVLKLVISENPEMKTTVRTSMALVKEEIAKVNEMAEDELGEFGGGEFAGDESTEYEMLEQHFYQKIQNDQKLNDQVKSLIIYGSYAKRLHVVGESDINFVIVLRSDSPKADTDEAIEKIGQIAEEIVTPEVAHIFDLMILKEEDLEQLEKFGPDFTHIHALYAKDGEVKLGENVFTSLNITNEQVQEAAKLLISDSILQWEEILNTAKEEGLPDDELEFLVGAPIIDIAFALCCYKVGINATKMDLVKPDIHEEIREVWGDESEFSSFYPLLQQAHAFKLGIRLPESQKFLEVNIEFIKRVIEYTKLQTEE
ncbi:MAG: nucleotidyltransferase domain-containing protein [Candidatus Hodarchaeota archaeon]